MYSVSEGGDKVELTKQLEGHSTPISDIVAEAGGHQLVSADDQGVIALWQDIGTAKEPVLTISDSRCSQHGECGEHLYILCVILIILLSFFL